MRPLSYNCTKPGSDVTIPAFTYDEVQALKERGFINITPVYTEIPKEPCHRTRDEYRTQVLAIRSGKRYSPIWDRRKETVVR